MRLAILVQDRSLRIIPHTHSTHLVDDSSRSFQTVVRSRSRFPHHWFSAHRMQNLFKSILHMLCLIDFVIRPGISEFQHRNTEFVHHIIINLTIIIFPGNALATSGKTNKRPIKPPVIFLQLSTISTATFRLLRTVRPPGTTIIAFDTPAKSITRHTHSRSEEHTSELQSLMRISYAVSCLKKKIYTNIIQHT